MEKEFVPYEPALSLKELGFDEPCFGYYVDGALRGIDLGMEELGGKEPYYQRFGFHTLSNHDIDNPNKIVVTAPTFSQAFRWFRDKYGLFTSIIVDQTTKPKFYYNISEYYEVETTWEWKDGRGNSSLYRIYEEAELACLIKLIEIVSTTPTKCYK